LGQTVRFIEAQYCTCKLEDTQMFYYVPLEVLQSVWGDKLMSNDEFGIYICFVYLDTTRIYNKLEMNPQDKYH
jgi:hypothetical protein